MKKLTKKPKLAVYIPIMAVLVVLAVAIQIANSMYGPVLQSAFAGSNMDATLQSTTHQTALDMNKQLEEEGAVLLKNDNNTLPIDASANSKVNLFGVKSVDMTYNASGSAAGSSTTPVTMKEGLESAGFVVNPDLNSMIAANTQKSDTAVHENGPTQSVNELDLSLYTGNCDFTTLKAYSNYAIVVIGRIGGEGADLARTGFGADGTNGYLTIMPNEAALLKALKTNGFTTIVLVNSSYAMELGFLEDPQYGVSAALWIGGPGDAGTLAVGEILAGQVVPSGRLVDTYAYDETTASTYYTSDNYQYVVDQGGGTYKSIGGYTDANEGIYVGYRWYETADAEGYWDAVGGYDKVVQYPFGYGLSYATFAQAFDGTPTFSDNTWTFQRQGDQPECSVRR